MWVYFLQIYDKVVFGQGNVFGLSRDLGLTSHQYAFAGTIHAIAQLGWQPVSSYLLVRYPARHLMTVFVFCWGVSAACMAASTNFRHIYVTRFFLGLFEAGCLPLFGLITAQWYRRSEQPIRIACWYGTNGLATIFASIFSYGFGHLSPSAALKPWQAIYLFAGLITIVTSAWVWWKLDSDIESARFFADDHEKAQAIERLRANQTGTGSREWKWDQALEVFVDPKSLLWLGIGLLPNIGAAVTNVFGPTLIRQFGFDIYVTTLLNIPFGALQTIAILIGCYCAAKFKIKAASLVALMIIALAGAAMLYVEAKGTTFSQPVALSGYYLLAFLFGGNPLIVSWMIANTAGQTKKSVIMALFNAASATGNIVGPLLFAVPTARAAERGINKYLPGTKAVMGIFCALVAAIGLQVCLLFLLNKQRQRQRVAHGKPKFIHDTSMDDRYTQFASDPEETGLGQNALLDMTDIKNDEFVYVY